MDERPAEDPAVRVVIVDDHQLLVASLRAALEADGIAVTVADLERLATLAEELAAHPPAVALLDLDLGGFGSGEAVLPGLVALRCRVLVVSGTSDEATIGRCLEAGAWGWVPKSAPFDDLLGALLSAADGQQVLSMTEKDRLLRAWRERRLEDAGRLAPFARLSPREAAVLAMLQAGLSVERIADASYVAEATVRTQVRSILAKLGVNSQLEAVAKAARAGWAGPSDLPTTTG